MSKDKVSHERRKSIFRWTLLFNFDEDGRRHFSCLCRFRPIPYVMCVWNLCSRSIVDRVCLVVKEWLKHTGLCSRFSSLIESVDLLFSSFFPWERSWKMERKKNERTKSYWWKERKKEGTTVSIYCPVWWREKVVEREFTPVPCIVLLVLLKRHLPLLPALWQRREERIF